MNTSTLSHPNGIASDAKITSFERWNNSFLAESLLRNLPCLPTPMQTAALDFLSSRKVDFQGEQLAYFSRALMKCVEVATLTSVGKIGMETFKNIDPQDSIQSIFAQTLLSYTPNRLEALIRDSDGIFSAGGNDPAVIKALQNNLCQLAGVIATLAPEANGITNASIRAASAAA